MTKLTQVKGIGESYVQKLADAGITTAEDLLEKAATPQGRKEVAEKSGVNPKLILTWANHVDLFRIKGVGEEYANLLEEAGVDTVPELAQRNAQNLHQKLIEANEADTERKLVRQIPSENMVADWVEQAKALPRILTY